MTTWRVAAPRTYWFRLLRVGVCLLGLLRTLQHWAVGPHTGASGRQRGHGGLLTTLDGGVEGHLGAAPVVHADAEHVPDVGDRLGLRVEVAINGLGDELHGHLVALAQALLNIVRQLQVLAGVDSVEEQGGWVSE